MLKQEIKEVNSIKNDTTVINNQEIKSMSSSRITAVDFVRGLVIILMALDHTSTYWNEGIIFGEFWFADFPTPIPDLLQFLVRFVSHWCAPTFG